MSWWIDHVLIKDYVSILSTQAMYCNVNFINIFIWTASPVFWKFRFIFILFWNCVFWNTLSSTLGFPPHIGEFCQVKVCILMRQDSSYLWEDQQSFICYLIGLVKVKPFSWLAHSYWRLSPFQWREVARSISTSPGRDNLLGFPNNLSVPNFILLGAERHCGC